jgi:hypothetical protein
MIFLAFDVTLIFRNYYPSSIETNFVLVSHLKRMTRLQILNYRTTAPESKIQMGWLKDVTKFKDRDHGICRASEVGIWNLMWHASDQRFAYLVFLAFFLGHSPMTTINSLKS